ncbi:MAG: hypothetical protein K9M75_00325, partial [Phycisphaerae bacterium]|nr:hypothetical protein [Phycisphaerae bacterium]
MRKSVILALLTCLLSNLVYADPIEVSGTVSPGFTGLDYWPVYSTLEIGADGLVKINDNGLVELFSGVSFDLGGQLAIDGGKLKVN